MTSIKKIAHEISKIYGTNLFKPKNQATKYEYKIRHRRLQDGKIIERRVVEFIGGAECICGCTRFKVTSYQSNMGIVQELKCIKCHAMPLLKCKAEELRKEMKPDLLEWLGYKEQSAVI